MASRLRDSSPLNAAGACGNQAEDCAGHHSHGQYHQRAPPYDKGAEDAPCDEVRAGNERDHERIGHSRIVDVDRAIMMERVAKPLLRDGKEDVAESLRPQEEECSVVCAAAAIPEDLNHLGAEAAPESNRIQVQQRSIEPIRIILEFFMWCHYRSSTGFIFRIVL